VIGDAYTTAVHKWGSSNLEEAQMKLIRRRFLGRNGRSRGRIAALGTFRRCTIEIFVTERFKTGQ
jgi:hypothetical protein